ncbi:NAD(P)-dependent alcohol dehydrogenase [Nocardioides luteus]|uniref:NAD(P)-dependent alcohol dehydrogenase n=1 Tax=Nocardioides luteus TaxID=1844 RepID=UPI0018CA1794|nr:NAD(P)-dependent alcohol dehydrogenase [Nocardioides luteus]MBG6096235.1 propanol-preferring alcohol dehydrogenase [Nocardioides luteus]
MTETMLAVRFEAWGERARLRKVPIPEPGPDGVLLQVTAAGICHSDLHVEDSPPGRLPFSLPFTLGHEVAGTVVAVGDDADPGWIGRAVVVHGVWGCGTCRRCRAGRENYCLERPPAIGNGLGYDGGLAEFMVVPSTRYLVPADGLDPVQAAPLTDAALTAYHALKPFLPELDAESRALVVGAGGLGHFAVQLLAQTAARIVVVDPKQAARELASELGAHETLPDLEAAAPTAATPTTRFDAVFDFVAAESTMAAAVSLLAPGGSVRVVGGAGGVLPVGKDLGFPQGWSVSAPFWGPKPDLAAVVELARAGRLHAHTETFPLTGAIEAYDRLRSGEIRGRAVVIPATMTSRT